MTIPATVLILEMDMLQQSVLPSIQVCMHVYKFIPFKFIFYFMSFVMGDPVCLDFRLVQGYLSFKNTAEIN